MLSGSCPWRGFQDFYTINKQTSSEISIAGCFFFFLNFLTLVSPLTSEVCLINSKSNILQQHKEFEEIEGRLQRREPLILGTTATQRLNRRLPVEVISDPLDDAENDPYEAGSDAHKLKGHQVNDSRLRSAGEASQRSTREDWAEWMRHFSIQLLKESPSPALRTCARLAQLQVLLDIFVLFIGVWMDALLFPI